MDLFKGLLGNAIGLAIFLWVLIGGLRHSYRVHRENHGDVPPSSKIGLFIWYFLLAGVANFLFGQLYEYLVYLI